MEEFNGSQFCSDHIIIELKFELEYKGKKTPNLNQNKENITKND